MSNPDQTPPRRGSRALIRPNSGQGSSARGGAPIPGQEPQPPAPCPVGRGIASEIPPGIPFSVGSGGLAVVDPGLGSGSTVVLRMGGVSSGGAGGEQRKRTREGEPEAGPSRPVRNDPPPPPFPTDLDPLPPPPAAGVEEGQGMFRCITCGRYFQSDRALCGHLRTHADRGYLGAFPPPVFTRQEFIDEGVEHLLNPLPDGGDAAWQGGAVADPEEATGEVSAPPNVPNVVQTGEAAAAASGAAERRDLDLNAPPPRDEHGDYI